MAERRLLCFRCALRKSTATLQACQRCGTLCCEHKRTLRASPPDGQLAVMCTTCVPVRKR